MEASGAVPVLRHYPLAREGPGTGVGSWQHPCAPASTSELTGSCLALIIVMERHFWALSPLPPTWAAAPALANGGIGSSFSLQAD